MLLSIEPDKLVIIHWINQTTYIFFPLQSTSVAIDQLNID